MIWIGILIGAVAGGSLTYLTFGVITFHAENKQIRRLRKALQEIIVESGRVDIENWPAQQQRCQAIAFRALHHKALEGD